MPLAIAHRGDPTRETENTLPGFQSAVRHGANMVEIDLRRTRDGVIVVLHDPSLTRIWGVDRQVSDMDLAELQELGNGTDRIPTLRQVLEVIQLPLMIDFTRREVVEGALHDVLSAGAMARSLFVTGNVEALRLLRSLSAEVRIGLTWVQPDPGPPPIALLEELGAEFWNPSFNLITPDRVAAVHDLGLQVSTWTVDHRRDMRRMIGAGVDAIVTNRIADLRTVLG